MRPFVRPGRVAIAGDERDGAGPPVVVVHDVGVAPDLARAIGTVDPARALVVPHLRGHGRSARVAGGLYTLGDLASDVVRAIEPLGVPCVVAGIGRSALVVAVAAAVAPGPVAAVVCAPGASTVACTHDPYPTRRAWVEGALAHDPDGGALDAEADLMARLPFAEPLLPSDRDELWKAITVPVVWDGPPTASWTIGARVDATAARSDDPYADVRAALAQLPA